MRVLLDEHLPHDFRHLLVGHVVETARYAGLEGFDDVRLIEAMAGRFDVLVTADAGLPFQQVLGNQPVSVVVLKVYRTRMYELTPLVPELLKVLATIIPSEVRYVGNP